MERRRPPRSAAGSATTSTSRSVGSAAPRTTPPLRERAPQGGEVRPRSAARRAGRWGCRAGRRPGTRPRCGRSARAIGTGSRGPGTPRAATWLAAPHGGAAPHRRPRRRERGCRARARRARRPLATSRAPWPRPARRGRTPRRRCARRRARRGGRPPRRVRRRGSRRVAVAADVDGQPQRVVVVDARVPQQALVEHLEPGTRDLVARTAQLGVAASAARAPAHRVAASGVQRAGSRRSGSSR